MWKKILAGLGVLIVLMVIGFLVVNESRPEGMPGKEAEALKKEMLNAINHDAWDSTHVIRFTFAGMHHFIWDKKRKLFQLEWNQTRVLYNMNSGESMVYQKEALVDGRDKEELEKTAYELFINDAFWLSAPHKVDQEGTRHSIVATEENDKALLVEYTKGGVTPGDAYLWFLDDKGRPFKWKMWVSIFPVGGVSVDWSGWTELESGAMVATKHEMPIYTLEITDLETSSEVEGLEGIEEDIFKPVLLN